MAEPLSLGVMRACCRDLLTLVNRWKTARASQAAACLQWNAQTASASARRRLQVDSWPAEVRMLPLFTPWVWWEGRGGGLPLLWMRGSVTSWSQCQQCSSWRRAGVHPAWSCGGSVTSEARADRGRAGIAGEWGGGPARDGAPPPPPA